MAKTITDIIREATEQTVSIKVKSIELVEGGKYKVCVCDGSFWLMPCMCITIGEAKGKVIYEDFEKDSCFLFVISSGSLTTEEDSFLLPSLGFVSGTVPMAAKTVNDFQRCNLPSPFVYLYEKYTSKKGNQFDVNSYKGVGVELFACADFPKQEGETWIQDQHDKFLIEPLNALIDFLLEQISWNKSINRQQFLEQTNTLTQNNTKWGDFKGYNGNEKATFNRRLDSVGVKTDIPVLKDTDCKKSCCC